MITQGYELWAGQVEAEVEADYTASSIKKRVGLVVGWAGFEGEGLSETLRPYVIAEGARTADLWQDDSDKWNDGYTVRYVSVWETYAEAQSWVDRRASEIRTESDRIKRQKAEAVSG